MNRVLHVSTLFYANYRSEQLPGLDYLHLFAVSYSTKLITYVVSGNFYFIFHATIYFWWMTASFDNLLWTHIFQWVGSMFLDPGRVLKDYFIHRSRTTILATRLTTLTNKDPFLVLIPRILNLLSLVRYDSSVAHLAYRYQRTNVLHEIMCQCRNYTNTSQLQYWFYADRNWTVLSTIHILDRHIRSPISTAETIPFSFR